MGAQQWVDMYRHESALNCITNLRTQGYQIIATTPHGEATGLEHFEIEGKSALFFGTEKEGLSEEVRSNADGYLTIPMLGFTESLNISVSVAIILHSLMEKLRKSDFDWSLTDMEKLEKRLDWTKKSIKSIDEILRRYHRSH